MISRFVVTELEGFNKPTVGGVAYPGRSCHVIDTACNHRVMAIYRTEEMGGMARFRSRCRPERRPCRRTGSRMKPRLLDLFCGAGGAAKGYQRAGFYVVGVDNRPQPNYCGDEFVQADALEYLHWLIAGSGGPYWLEDFAGIHASPPCQFFTQMRASWRAQGVNDGYVDLLTPTLELLRPCGLPYVVENVVGARKAMRETLMLHGGMFGLAVHRPRVFETSFLVLAPKAAFVKEPIGVYDTRPRGKTHHRTRLNGNGKGRSEMRIARTLEEGQEAMGIDWMEWLELKESIPPAYTELIGHQLAQHIGALAA